MKASLVGGIALAAMMAVGKAADGPGEKVAEIRKWYAAIDKGKPSAERKVEFKAEDEPLFGSLVARDYADGLQAVTVSYVAGDHGGSDEHYYFKDGVLFFVFEVRSWWQFAPGGTPEQPRTEDRRTEVRYYFDGGTCIRQLRRSATSEDAEKLPAMVAKLEQKPVKPGEDAERLRVRGGKLRKATSAEAVLAAFR